MRKILDIAHVSGLYHRELTKLTAFTGDTRLDVIHT
ncbi:DUF2871 family protein [Nonomuraea jabiensis]